MHPCARPSAAHAQPRWGCIHRSRVADSSRPLSNDEAGRRCAAYSGTCLMKSVSIKHKCFCVDFVLEFRPRTHPFPGNFFKFKKRCMTLLTRKFFDSRNGAYPISEWARLISEVPLYERFTRSCTLHCTCSCVQGGHAHSTRDQEYLADKKTLTPLGPP